MAILRTVALDDVEPEVAEAFEAAVARLTSAGATIEEIDVPQVAEALPLSTTLFSSEAYGIWSETIEASPETMFPPILERFRGGKGILASDYVAAWAKLEDLRRGYLAATAGYDAILLPTCPILPPEVERLLSDAAYFAERNLLTLRNTRIGNLMGLPGLSLPTEAPGVGLLVQTPPMTEARLLRIGAGLEAALA